MTPEPEVTIRPRRDDDLDELARILVQVHAQNGYPVEGVADPYAWLHLEQPLGAWVAELDGKVVGHVALTEPGPHDHAPRIWAELAGEPVERTAVLGRLFVSPDARGHQLGRRLCHTATAAASAHDRTAVLDVMLKDEAAIATYTSLGWRAIGDFTHHHSMNALEPARAFMHANPRRQLTRLDGMQ
ncbi:GNAT family N-acetyltransferase [Arsenicicoccus dermatophilus]|uniref:GNAT family N-acetyltransferase n=1 Tax=Arsenicicoccus dermatophilus TaxID=1076331 RepID=UPI001F4C87C2|nr:GNAT family N-acetyltransferase [Arsenicicoccus dermatophilus]MCH8611896.1 GNAT family N-acetyltransferase [Arsenicicoccus dermatophilus]